MRKPLTWVVVAVLAIGGGFGLYWFQPWKLVTDQKVNDDLSIPATVSPTGGPTGGSTPTGPATTATPTVPVPPVLPGGPQVLAEGTFVTHEHATTGTARLVRAADGTLRLELVGLDTSNGPDLRVWLTDQPVIAGRDGWHVFDDGKYHELGRLKGNQGNQVYAVPADLSLDQFTSVSIWCKRFAVSFGAAPLTPS